MAADVTREVAVEVVAAELAVEVEDVLDCESAGWKYNTRSRIRTGKNRAAVTDEKQEKAAIAEVTTLVGR